MPVQERERDYLSTPNNFANPGGRFEPVLNPLIAPLPTDRILPATEAQKAEFKPIERAPNLIMNVIPKWDMAAEMNRFVNDINAKLAEEKSLLEAVSKSAQELEMNVRAFDSEIIKSQSVLLHLNRFDLINGAIRIVGNNGKPVVDSISAKERKGSVLDGSREIEHSLVEAENNSFAVLMSPAGWHGFTDQYGREISPHRNAQALVFWKDKKGELSGLTFHVDLELEQAKSVMLSLGVSEKALAGETEHDRIINIVKNPALLSVPAAYDNPFEYVLDKILAARGSHAFKLLQENGKEEIRPIDKIRADIRRFEQLLKGNQEEERHIAELINYVLAEASGIGKSEVQQQIIYRVEKTLLRLTRVYLQDNSQIPILQFSANQILVPSVNNGSLYKDDGSFAREIAYLKTRAGCPPSMTSATILSGISLGSSSGSIDGSSSGLVESDSKGSLYFPCPACGTINKRPIEGYVESCQNPNCPSPGAVRC